MGIRMRGCCATAQSQAELLVTTIARASSCSEPALLVATKAAAVKATASSDELAYTVVELFGSEISVANLHVVAYSCLMLSRASTSLAEIGGLVADVQSAHQVFRSWAPSCVLPMRLANQRYAAGQPSSHVARSSASSARTLFHGPSALALDSAHCRLFGHS